MISSYINLKGDLWRRRKPCLRFLCLSSLNTNVVCGYYELLLWLKLKYLLIFLPTFLSFTFLYFACKFVYLETIFDQFIVFLNNFVYNNINIYINMCIRLFVFSLVSCHDLYFGLGLIECCFEMVFNLVSLSLFFLILSDTIYANFI